VHRLVSGEVEIKEIRKVFCKYFVAFDIRPPSSDIKHVATAWIFTRFQMILHFKVLHTFSC